MTITPRTESQIMRDIDALDIPVLPVIAAIEIVADYLDLDAIAILRRMQSGQIKFPESDRVITDLMENAMETSFQIGEVIRGLELDAEIADL